MARKRMIDPDFWADEKLGSLSRDERLLFMGLISNADDEGRGRANHKLVKSTIFPYDEDLTAKSIENMLLNLVNIKILVLYIIGDQEFYCLPNFLKHQNINRPLPSKLPLPTDESIHKKNTDDSLSNQGDLTSNRREEKRKEYNAHSSNDLNSFFETIWKLYPHKKGKGQISPTQKAKLFNIGQEEITRIIERYKQSKPDWQAWQNGSTFFNSGYVDYLDENYSSQKGLPAESNPEYMQTKNALNEGVYSFD